MGPSRSHPGTPPHSNAQRGELPRTRQLPIEYHLGHENRCKHVGEKADDQGHRKAFDGSGAEQKQEAAGNDGRHVRVDNCPPSLAETGIHSRYHCLARPQLLADALENQHIAVHRHTDSQDDASDARQREYSVEVGERGHQDDRIENQRHHGVDPGALVVDEHHHDHRHQTDQARGHTFTNGIGAQRRTDGALLQIEDAGRQRTGPQHQGEVGRLLFAAQPGNASTIVDARLNGRHTVDPIIQDNSQSISDVGLREAAKAAAAILGQGEISFPLSEFVPSGTRISQRSTRNYRRARNQVPPLALIAARRHLHKFRVEGQHAAMFGQGGFPRGEGAVFDFDNLQYGRRTHDLFDARRIVHAR